MSITFITGSVVTLGAGEKGWSPQIEYIEDDTVPAEPKIYARLKDWVGGQGTKPGNIGKYYGANGYVDTTAEAYNFKGANGIPGGSGGAGGNADTLQGQNGTYYLNRTNHTGNTPLENVAGLQAALDAKADNAATTTALAGKAAVSHTHPISQVTGLQTALDAKAEAAAMTTALAGKAPTSHTHTIANVTTLQTTLDAKVNSSSLAAVATTGSFADLTNKPRYESLASLPGDLSGYPDGSEILLPL